MKIDFGSLDRERFHVNERNIPGLGDFVLIVPHKAMWAWDESELHLRSLLCRPDGEVVSSGFPKFFNFGEKPEHDALVTKGLKEGAASFTEKADGSLIIRSVIDGQVHFRTRGCEVIASDMRQEVETLIAQKYPSLLNPQKNWDNHSFLMEYVSPKNQIVVRYPEPELISLGWVGFSGDQLNFSPSSWDGMRHVARYELPTDVKALQDAVAGFDDREGIVVWTRYDHVTAPQTGMVHLSKFKSKWYLRLHSLRSQATPRYLKEFCFFNNINSLEELRQAFFNEGFDWETVAFIEPMFAELRAHVEAVEQAQATVDAVIQTQLKQLMVRKEIALKAKELEQTFPGWFAYMMSRALGEDSKADEMVAAMKLDMNAAQLRQLKKSGPEKLGTGKVVDDG